MKLKNIISSLAMIGALGSGGAAFAQRWTGHHHSNSNSDSNYENRDGTWHRTRSRADIIGTGRLDEGRGTVAFTFQSGMRRDGLALSTNAGHLRILSVEFVYSDGRVVRERVRQSLGDGQMMTIQTGRPPGLRVVRVRYAMGSDDSYGYDQSSSARLRLIQIHTGDGYTHDEDLWKNHPDEGYYPDDDRDVDEH
jgi:hypothetical protein